MELTNRFRVDVPVDEAWIVLTDVERIAPCMPGAELQEVAGDDFRGIVKVKVGPITAQYKGTAKFLEKDDAEHKAVLRAEGRDTRGQGNANATITATLKPDGAGTEVTVVTDLTVTGKVAQFGRGVLADVSSKLLTQFVDCLHDDLLSDDARSVAGDTPAEGDGAPPEAKGSSGNGATSTSPTSASTTVPSNGHAASPAATATTTTTTTTAPQPSASAAAGSAASATTGSAPSTGATTSGPTTSSTQTDGVRKIESRPAQPVDLLDAAGVPVAKRAIPVVAGVLVILWFMRRRRKRSR